MPKHDDKTEKPTPKRRREARRKGQVARSPDVAGWMVVLAATLLVPVLFRATGTRVTALWGEATQVMTNPTPAGALRVLQSGLGDVVALVLPLVGGFAVVAVASNVAQTGLVFAPQAAAPKFDHLNPISGIKRLVSVNSLWMLVKQVLKLACLVLVAGSILRKLGTTLVGSQPVDMAPLVSYAGSTILGMVRDVAAVGLVLGVADYAVQRHRTNKSLKMTKHEVKEENRQSEGDPTVKREVRKKQYRLSRTRMMAAVAGADVIVVNPTHFAVALSYDPAGGRAPRVVAKGTDDLAWRIRQKGTEHGVPIVEDPPLARAIYSACDVDAEIPHELYVAVARLLAFVFTLPAVVRASGAAHRRPTTALIA